MICEEQIHMQKHLEGLEASPDQKENQPPHERTSKSLEERKEYMRQWRSANKERCRLYSRNEYRRNYANYRDRRGKPEYKAKLREYMRGYRTEYPERYLAALKKSNHKHKAKRQAYLKRPENKARRRAIENRRYRTDPQYQLAKRLRARLSEEFKLQGVSRNDSVLELTGCSYEFLKCHIESQFTNGMVWGDSSTYEVDHIVPLSAFDMRDDEEAKASCNWRNLRPMTPYDNASKQDTIQSPLPPWLPAHIAERIINRTETK